MITLSYSSSDDEPSAWCYTMESSKRWEYCDVISSHCEERKREIHEMEQMEGVRITTKVRDVNMNLAAKKDVEHDTFWCLFLGSCNQVIVDTSTKTLWNITPFKFEGIQCYRIEKASGHLSRLSIAPSSSQQAVTLNRPENRANCWEFVPVNQNAFNIRKRLGDKNGKMLTSVPADEGKSYLYVVMSQDESNNVSLWEITYS